MKKQTWFPRYARTEDVEQWALERETAQVMAEQWEERCQACNLYPALEGYHGYCESCMESAAEEQEADKYARGNSAC